MRALSLGHSSSGGSRLRKLLRPAVLGELFVRLWQTAEERRHLGELDPRLLKDIGIDPMTARHEVSRPFWQLPRHHETQLARRLER